MKKALLIALVTLTIGNISSQTFCKGDMIVDFGLGVGVADACKMNKEGGVPVATDISTGTFSQKVGFEFGVVDLNCGSIGIGALITNAYGFGVDGLAIGSYDYTYQILHYKKGNRGHWTIYDTTYRHRQGTVTEEATTHIDDINILLKGSFHKEFVKGLDTYATLGLGASFYTNIVTPTNDVHLDSDKREFVSDYNNTYQLVYSYDDSKHLEWQDGTTKARFAMALFVGARYYLTSNWGIFCELGLTSASLKKSANVYNILSLGATYKF